MAAAAPPPSVDALARALADDFHDVPQPLLVDAARAAIAAHDPESAAERVTSLRNTFFRPVINATGVLLHTNLGRAPLALHADGDRYSNLELDLSTGQRGSRFDSVGRLLARACGAEAAIVVNNGAAALLLVLAALAGEDAGGVVVSRGELVEIGGGFRVPEVMEQSGATLVEVGTTNRTRIDDYRRAVARSADVRVLLKVHRSNYRIEGFTEETSVAALAALGDEVGAPVVADIGSGLLDSRTPWLHGPPPAWLTGEPAAVQTLAAGAALVTFSGDKLFGGPQAGVIAGRADLVEICRRHPLARALRPGSLVLGAMHDVAFAYLRRNGTAIPFWRLATIPVETLRRRAETIVADVETRRQEAVAGSAPTAMTDVAIEVVSCASTPGGGSLPDVEIASAGITVDGDHTASLRAVDPPIVARVAGGRTILDLRTVSTADDGVIVEAVVDALASNR